MCELNLFGRPCGVASGWTNEDKQIFSFIKGQRHQCILEAVETAARAGQDGSNASGSSTGKAARAGSKQHSPGQTREAAD